MTPEEVERRFRSLVPPLPPAQLRELCLPSHLGGSGPGSSIPERPGKPRFRQSRWFAAFAAAGCLVFAIWLGAGRLSGTRGMPAQEPKKESAADHEKREALTRLEVTHQIARRLEEAYAAFSRKDFERSSELSRQILSIDPHYPVARELVEDFEKSRRDADYVKIAGKKVYQWKGLTSTERGVIPWAGTLRYPSSDEWARICGHLQEDNSKKPGPPAGESLAEMNRLINELASDEQADREAARKRLLALGFRALGELDRALYHENADVRIRAGELSREIREHLEYDPLLAFVRTAVELVRKHWIARDFAKIESMVADAFSPMLLKHVPHYVPKRVVFDPSRDLASVMSANGTGEDFLSKAVADELDKEAGMVYLEFPTKDRVGGTFRDWGTLFFTLPDRKGWSAYVVVDLPSPADFREKNCTVDTLWGRWTMFGASLQLEGLAKGILVTGAGTADFWAPETALLKSGDLVREVNGKPASNVGDVRSLFENPPSVIENARGRLAGRDVRSITVDRNGKLFSARIQLIVP